MCRGAHRRPGTGGLLTNRDRPRAYWLHPKEGDSLPRSGTSTGVPPLARRIRPLEAHPVDLVTGGLRREPAVCVFGGSAVIDDPVDFAGNRHGNAVRIGELHDDADSFDALGDLVHRCDDFVDRLACAELLADMAGAAGPGGAPEA